MNKPAEVPETVKAAIEKYNSRHPEVKPVSLEELQWNALSGYYSFTRSGMYHGVELDGYIHT